MAMVTSFTDSTARKRIAAARSDMILDEPFFGALALRLKLIEDRGCDTAWTDGVHLGYDPKFVASLKADELMMLVKHEVLHCSNGHPWRRDSREPRRFNEACDYAINPILVQAGGKLPAGGLLDPKYSGKSAEWIYDRLPAQQQKSGSQPSQDPGSDPQDGAGSGRGQAPQPQGSTKDKPEGSPQGGPPSQPSKQPGGTAGKPGPQQSASGQQKNPLGEVRDAPSEGSDDEAVPTEEDWRQATIQAAVLAKGQGKLPAGMERYIERVMTPKIDWRSALRRFVQEVAKSDYSFARPNSRYVAHGMYLPALHSHQIGDLAIGVDTSGSVDAVLLGQFEAEIRAIADEVKPRSIKVLYCDAAVHREETFERGDEVKLHPCGGGGTDFRPVFTAVAKWEDAPVAVVYLTDLYGTFPESDPGLPVMWVTPDHDDSRTVPFGELVTA